jgi:hypothetical protein
MALIDTSRKADTLVLTADLTTAELAEALASLRFQSGSRCLVSLDKGVRTSFCAVSKRGDARRFQSSTCLRRASFMLVLRGGNG